jgi:hypothetical protein
MSLHFTAEHSLGRSLPRPADRAPERRRVARTSNPHDHGRVLPQLTVTGCGSASLNTACFWFAAPAWVPCESAFWWNQGAAGGCMYWSMVGASPGCFRCTVIAP